MLGYTLEKSLPAADDRACVSEEAAQSFQRSIELNPGFAESFYRLGKMQFEIDPEEAAWYFDTVVRLDKSNDAAKYQLARLYLKSRRREEGGRLIARSPASQGRPIGGRPPAQDWGNPREQHEFFPPLI